MGGGGELAADRDAFKLAGCKRWSCMVCAARPKIGISDAALVHEERCRSTTAATLWRVAAVVGSGVACLPVLVRSGAWQEELWLPPLNGQK